MRMTTRATSVPLFVAAVVALLLTAVPPTHAQVPAHSAGIPAPEARAATDDSTLQELPLSERIKESIREKRASIRQKGEEVVDKIRNKPMPPGKEHDWWQLLRRGRLDINDTTVEYPKFLDFLVRTYRVADRFMSAADTAYIAGSPHKFKALLRSDNWADTYSMHLDKYRMHILLNSQLSCNLGAFLSFGGLSVGYSVDITNLVSNKPANYTKFDFGFGCQVFSLEGYYQENKGGSTIRRFGDYRDGEHINEKFPGVYLRTYGIDAYYFLNSRRYSQAAAYSFSKFQKRTAGSWIFGLTYSNQNITLDFGTLPQHLLDYLLIPPSKYKFHYENYCVMFGYGLNWVFAPGWCYNITLLPSVGLNSCYEDSLEGSRHLTSLNIKARSSLVWNINDFFIGVAARIDGHWYLSPRYSFFNSIDTFVANFGIRF